MYWKSGIIATLFVVFLPGTPLRAETVTATGVIEGVDIGARTVTVRRKTAKGEKTAKLTLGPKAEVIVDNQPGDLASLKAGQSVTVSYDTTAKFVTKLEAWPTNTSSSLQIHRDLAYAEPANDHQTLDVYAPANAQGLPVVIWLHGGGWQTGDKSEVDGKPRAFTDKGFIFVSANYRLLPNVAMETIMRDAAKSIRWVHEQIKRYGGDPERLCVTGHSAGAQLAALVCTDDRYLKGEGMSLASIKACVAVDGDTYDVLLIIDTAAKRRKALGQPEPKFGHFQKFGGTRAKHRDFSAVFHIARGKEIPPFLLLHVADNSDTTAQAKRLASALSNAGISARLFGAQDTDHIRINSNLGRRDDPATEVLFEFLSTAFGLPNEKAAPVGQASGKRAAAVSELFNGTDLSGWSLRKPRKIGINNEWLVDRERKVLISPGGDGSNWLESAKSYKNFVLSLEYRFPPGGDAFANGSGVVVRANGLNTTGYDPRGIEIDLTVEVKEQGSGTFRCYETPLSTRTGESVRGQPQAVLVPFEYVQKPMGEWNTLEIACDDDRIAVKINGELVNEGTGANMAAGKICLRNQSTSVEFRKIDIEPLR